MTVRIPALLHQTWRSADLPAPFSAWRRGWIEQHPGWEHRFYDDAAVERVVVERAPEWLPTYLSLPLKIQRLDFFRYLIVFLDGGLYADIDTVCLRACDTLLDGATCVLGVESEFRPRWQRAFGYATPFQFANFIFAAAPGHPLLRSLLEAISRSAGVPCGSDEMVEDTTGPRMLTRVAGALPADARWPIRILPQLAWNPPPLYPNIGPLRSRIFVRHTCSGSWRTSNAPARQMWRALGRRLPNPLPPAVQNGFAPAAVAARTREREA